ncbi:hypothetical protein NT07LI_3503, partial [Listeria innocua FSL S4-378]
GMVFLFTVIPTSSNTFSAAFPVKPSGFKSINSK